MSVVNALLEGSHPTVKLTKKERHLLKALASDNGSRVSLFENVWGFAAKFAAKATYKDTRSVDMAVSRLRNKCTPLGLHIVSVRGSGYRLLGDV
jgi:DNA-binding response OmpR family regulator